MPVQFEQEKSKQGPQTPYFEDITGDAGFRGYSTTKSEERLLSDVTAALGRLNGRIISVQRGTWIDEKKRKRFIYDFMFSLPGPGGHGSAMGNIQVAALPLRTWTEKKDLQSRKAALYVLVHWLEAAFNFHRVTPVETATLLPFMLDNTGMTLAEAYITGRISDKLLTTSKENPEDILDAEVEDI